MSIKSLFRFCSKCDEMTAHSDIRCITCGTMFVSPRAYSPPANYGGQTDAANRRRIAQATARMSRRRNRLGQVGEGS